MFAVNTTEAGRIVNRGFDEFLMSFQPFDFEWVELKTIFLYSIVTIQRKQADCSWRRCREWQLIANLPR